MFIGGARGLPSKGPAPRPRPALPPALPAPRGTPTYRPGQVVNNAAVQRYEPAPVRAAQHQAAQRAAYVAAPHHYGPVAPPVNVRRSTVNTTGSPAHATTQRLAKAIGGSRGNAAGAPFTLARVVAGMSRYAAAHPFEPIATNARVATKPLRDMQFQGLFNQEFQTLQKQGLLPKGATQPRLVFPARGAGAQGGLSFETGHGRNALVHMSAPTVDAAVDPSSPAHAWGVQTPIHELAHALQNSRAFSTVPQREGGAQAYADAAATSAVGPISQNDTNYSGYTQAVRGMGPQWFMQGQFNHRRRRS